MAKKSKKKDKQVDPAELLREMVSAAVEDIEAQSAAARSEADVLDHENEAADHEEETDVISVSRIRAALQAKEETEGSADEEINAADESPTENTEGREASVEEAAEATESSEGSDEVSEETLIAEGETIAAEGEVAASDKDSDTETDEVVVSHKITDLGEIEQAVEALVFAAPKAMSHQRLRAILAANNFDTSALPDVLKSIEHAYSNRGFNLIKVAGGYQFRSHPKHSDILEKLVEDKPQRLGTSALEVLAIVAYKQPVTRAEIDAVRGVDSGHLLRGLLEKNLCRTEGHAETVGRPLLYGTTPYFLEIFGLNSLDDLPALEEFQRELIEQAGGEGADAAAASLEAALLGTDGMSAHDNSGLAANPDRGAFDQPAEERFEDADFGVMSAETENTEETERPEEESPPPSAEA
jgi:segregation and condensation protein B